MYATSARRRAASARHAATAGARSGPRVGAGHSNEIASSAATEARPQPSSRSGIVDAGLASETGRMNASSSDVDALASTELTTPAKSTQNATTAIEIAASQVVARGERADADEDGSGHGERHLGLQPLAHRAAEVDQQQHRERPEGREGGEPAGCRAPCRRTRRGPA